MRLGARIVRELKLEPSDTLGRWMAHHLAEMLEEVGKTEGRADEIASQQVTDLILKIWSHKKSLPHGAYPLNKLENALSVIGRLSPAASPYQWHSTDETEKLLSRIFDGLRRVVMYGIILISRTKDLPDDLEAVIPFMEDDERQFIEVIQGWIDYANTERPYPSFVIRTEADQADWDAKQVELAELEKLDPKSRSNRILSREIDGLIEALSDLKLRLTAEDPDPNREN